MTETEKSLLETLLALEETVGRMAVADPKPDVSALFSQIDALTAQLPAGTDPNLLHYLQKMSYQKARLFLQGRDAANQVGQCGHL